MEEERLTEEEGDGQWEEGGKIEGGGKGSESEGKMRIAD